MWLGFLGASITAHLPDSPGSACKVSSDLGRDGIQKPTPAYTEEIPVGSDALLEVGGFGNEFCVGSQLKLRSAPGIRVSHILAPQPKGLDT